MIAKKIDFLQYFFLFEKYKSALSDLLIRRHKNIILIGAFDDNDGDIGLLLVLPRDGTSKIMFASALNDDCDIYKLMINCALEELKGKTDTLEWWLVEENEKYEIEKKCAEDLKFVCYNSLNIFRHNKSDKEKALAFVEENKSISDWFIKKGYEIKSFAELSNEQLDYMSNNPDNQFESSLHIGDFINNKSMDLCKDKSFACIKDGKVIAFASVSTVSKGQYVYDSTCVAKDYKMSGVFVPVNNAVFNAVFNSDYNSLLFAVYDKNNEMLPVFKKWLMPLITSSTKQFNYIRPIEIPDEKKWDAYRRTIEEVAFSSIDKELKKR